MTVAVQQQVEPGRLHHALRDDRVVALRIVLADGLLDGVALAETTGTGDHERTDLAARRSVREHVDGLEALVEAGPDLLVGLVITSLLHRTLVGGREQLLADGRRVRAGGRAGHADLLDKHLDELRTGGSGAGDGDLGAAVFLRHVF